MMENEGYESDWTHLVTNSAIISLVPTKVNDPRARSIFDDVDQS